MHTSAFWHIIDTLVANSEILIDRPQGSAHPRYPDIIYPFDYGYLKGTNSGDGQGIDIWRGSLPEQQATAIIVSADSKKHDAEIKILLGCTAEEMQIILAVHNRRPDSQAAILIER